MTCEIVDASPGSTHWKTTRDFGPYTDGIHEATIRALTNLDIYFDAVEIHGAGWQGGGQSAMAFTGGTRSTFRSTSVTTDVNTRTGIPPYTFEDSQLTEESTLEQTFTLPLFDNFDTTDNWYTDGEWGAIALAADGQGLLLDTAVTPYEAVEREDWLYHPEVRLIGVHTLELDGWVDLRNTERPILAFWQFARTQPNDIVAVDVLPQGSTQWEVVYTQTGLTTRATWQEHRINLREYTGQLIRLRFRVGPLTARSTSVYGIDTLSIRDARVNVPVEPTQETTIIIDAVTVTPIAPMPTENAVVVTEEATVEVTEVVTEEATVEATAIVTEEPKPTETATPVPTATDIPPTATLLPTWTPTTIPPTATPALLPLELTPLCDSVWRIDNPNLVDIRITWQGTGGETGTILVPASGSITFTGPKAGVPMTLFVNGQPADVVYHPADCTPETQGVYDDLGNKDLQYFSPNLQYVGVGCDNPTYIATLDCTRTEYQYDALNRLTRAYSYNAPNRAALGYVFPDNFGTADMGFQYTYDWRGNITQELSAIPQSDGDLDVGAVARTYDVANRLVEETNSGSGTVDFTYDPNGFLRAAHTDGIGYDRLYRYNSAGHLVQVAHSDTNEAIRQLTTYGYDGAGTRLWQQFAENCQGLNVNAMPWQCADEDRVDTFTYLTDVSGGLAQAQVLAQYIDVGNDTRIDNSTYYLMGLSHIGQWTSDIHGNTQWGYYGTDALGSTRQMTDSNGLLRMSATYDPYGAARSIAGDVPYIGYAGQGTDPNGLIYLRNRYYNPSRGVLLTPDPIRGVVGSATSFNGYIYANSNPINYTDPSGCSAILASIAFALAFEVGMQLLLGCGDINWGNVALSGANNLWC